MQFSPDGQWFWDGAQWRPAYSPDRAWRWDGRQWVPGERPQPRRWRYEPTPWTRRLQLIVLGLLVLGLLATIVVVPSSMLPLMQESIDRSLASQRPDPSVDPAQLRQFMTTFLYATVGAGAVIGAAVYAVIVVGVLRLWRWIYWYLVVIYLLGLLAVPQDILYALGYGTLHVPTWWIAIGIPMALLEAALAAWMIVLYRRVGTWARRRLPA